MTILLKKSAMPLISGLVLIVVVALKLLGFKLPLLGFIGFAAMIFLLISSFQLVFLPQDEQF